MALRGLGAAVYQVDRYRLCSENKVAGQRAKWIRVEKRSRCGVTVGHLWEAGACGFCMRSNDGN